MIKVNDQEIYAQLRREIIESGIGRAMWDAGMRWHTEMVLDDLQEFASTYETWPTSPSEFLEAYKENLCKTLKQ
jgi:hypothetical protein